jgi:hypothetical protein
MSRGSPRAATERSDGDPAAVVVDLDRLDRVRVALNAVGHGPARKSLAGLVDDPEGCGEDIVASVEAEVGHRLKRALEGEAEGDVEEVLGISKLSGPAGTSSPSPTLLRQSARRVVTGV